MGKRFDQPLIPVKGPTKAKPGQQGEKAKTPAPTSAPRQVQRSPSGNRRGG